jgi:hypothetical protein
MGGKTGRPAEDPAMIRRSQFFSDMVWSFSYGDDVQTPIVCH